MPNAHTLFFVENCKNRRAVEHPSQIPLTRGGFDPRLRINLHDEFLHTRLQLIYGNIIRI